MSEALTARGGARGGSSRGRGRSAAVAMRGRARPATAPGTNADEAGEVPLEAVSAAEPMRRLPGPDLNNKRIIKVSKDSDVKKVAGSIAHIIRETGGGPVILASGPSSVNQTIKALAVARKYLEQEPAGAIELYTRPHFDGSSQRLTLTVRVDTKAVANAGPEEALTVKSISVPAKVAGAIAGRVRDDQPVHIITVGKDGVFGTIDAIAMARRYLLEDHKDLEFVPHFIQLEWDGHSTNGLCLVLVASPA